MNAEATTLGICRVCGAPTPSDAPLNQCPHCLLDAAFVTPVEPISSSRGRQFADYELMEQIGRGGMGVVYRARQVSLHRVVAVKMLLNAALSSPAMVRRFEIEAETAARLDHPNIVPIYEIGEEDGQHFFTMKLVEGRSLAAAIHRQEFAVIAKEKSPALNQWNSIERRIAHLMIAVCRAADYAHSMGVLHRDLKPGNVLIDSRGEPHLTDFGLAKADVDPALTGSGSVLGTPAYMAPEQAAGGAATRATDVYALGVILYELLTGRVPFRGTTPVETLRRVVDEQAAPVRTVNALVHPDLAVICAKALEKDPLRRYDSAGELANDLDRWTRHEPIRARPAGLVRRTNRWIVRNRLGTALILVLCAGVAASASLAFIVSRQERARRAALQTLIYRVNDRIEELSGPEKTFEHLTAEELRAIVRHDPERTPFARRFTVATLIDQNPIQTVYAFSALFSQIEDAMTATLNAPVRLDLRLYKTYDSIGTHVANGEIHFAYVDARVWRRAARTNSAVHAVASDRRDGLEMVIFARVGSGVTNLLGLRGKTLSVGSERLIPNAYAKAQLAAAGLCSDDVACIPVEQEFQNNSVYFKRPVGYFSRSGEIVRSVMREKKFPAGIATGRHIQQYREGEQWIRLATFRVPEFLWIAGPNVSTTESDALLRALSTMRDPKELDALLVDTQTDGFGFARVTKQMTAAVDKVLQQEKDFERCAGNLEQKGEP